MLKRIFTGLYHFCWYAFAFIVLTAAVLATVVRLALPEIGGYKDEIQSWVSEYMDYPVVIDEINAEWQGWAPHLYLKNIDLYTVDNSSLITKFDSAHLSIDLFASLNQRELVPSHLSISGLNLEFTRNIDGSISINSGKNNNINTNPKNNAALSEWLLKQKYIVLENANLIWHDKKASKEKRQFSNVQLKLKTQEQRVQVGLYIPLAEKLGQSLTMKMDVTGSILTPDWNGTVYLEAKEINPTNLLDDLPVKSIGGSANAKLWTNWNKAKLVDISGEIRYSDFSLSTDQYNLPINNIGLNLYAERKKDKDWLINVTIKDLETSHGLWPSSNYQLKIEKNEFENNYRYSGYFSYLKLEETLPFVVASNIIPENILEKIHWQSVKGELTNINIGFDPASKTEETIWFNTLFKNLVLASNDKKNTVSGLEGSITASNKSTKILLDSKYPEINPGSIFDKPYLLSAINAELELIHNDSIELLINKLHIEDNYISAISSGKILFNEASPFIDVVVHLDETGIENLPAYLPKQTSHKLRDWFTQALVGGQLLSGDLIFRGHAANFPFNNSEGNFKAVLNVDDATFYYAKGWPPIDKLTAEVIIDNDDLYVSSNSGYVFDATIQRFTANIINLAQKNPHVIINGSIDGHTSDAGNFITQSPLNENSSLSKLTENVSGGINLKLKLDIPINSKKTYVEGLITFSDTTLESNLPGLALEDVNGKVNFTTQEVWADDIDALYHGKPVKFTIPRFDRDESNSESYVISGVADKEFIINQLTNFFPSLYSSSNSISESFSGESTWSLSLKKLISREKIERREVEINSDLKGIAINLPYPLGKKSEEIKSLSVKTKLTDLSINEININYDNSFFTDFNVDNTEDLVVKNILIGLGQQHSEVPISDDISIQGELEELNVSEWIDFINLGKASPSQNNNRKIINGNIYVKQFNMLGNEFNNVNIKLSNPIDGWQILFDGEKIKGQTNFIMEDNNRLHANFEKLTLKKPDDDKNSDENENQIAIDKIPELEVNIDEFTYNDNELGQLNLQTSNINNGININKLSIIKPGFSINAKGEWMQIDDVDRSDFYAMLETDSIETMLGTFNFNSANIKEGQTTIEMNANWMDTPMNFSMEKINGELSMNIGKGHFLDINPTAGRLFGLLSIQTLPRRLTLDFTDLFEEGFAFDSIKGNFSLQQGHAYTNNLEMTGPSANIIVSGRTGLATEDYDQIATVTPKISSGLPVASALFGPVGVGVGAVIYLAGEIFKSLPKKIDKILSHQYSITGSWNNPNIEKVEEEEKDRG
jgi:uncharacterized protein (TIGR02099 family)